MLFAEISDVKAFVGGGANLSMEMDSINPTMLSTAQKYLVPAIGPLWQELKLAYDNDDLSAAQEALLPYVQRPLAYLSLYEYAQIASVQFGEAGLFRVEGENAKTPYKYQENAYKDHMLHTGYEALEWMLKFLHANAIDYPTWIGSDAFARMFSGVLNLAEDMRSAYSKYLSRYTFEVIRPIITDVENFALVPLMGKNQYLVLIANIQENDLTPKERQLCQLCQKAVANLAMMEATARLWVRIEGAQVLQSERLEPQGYEKTSPPIASALGFKMRREELMGNRYIAEVKSYLSDNAEDFPLYAQYLADIEESAAIEAEANDMLAATRDRQSCCAYWPHCGHSHSTTTKGIVRL